MIFNTINTIVTDLLNVVRSSNVSASETISRRQLEEWVHQYRARLLKQDLDKGKYPNPDYIQQIDNIELEQINEAGEDILTGTPSDWFVLRTTLEIPKTIDLNFSTGIMYVGTPEGHEIQYIPECRNKWQRWKKYTFQDRLCYLKNGYMYVASPVAMKYLTIRGVFEIPTEVSRFINPVTAQPYSNLDSKYPMPNNLIPALKEMILAKELQIHVTSATDTTNDARSNPTQISN